MNLVYFLLGALTVTTVVPILDKLVELICTTIYLLTNIVGGKIVEIDHATQEKVAPPQEEVQLMPQIGFEIPSEEIYEEEFEEDEE